MRLVQSQHRQLEGQLRSSADKLRAMPADSVLQLRRFLEQGLRPVGGPGTLGCGGGGVEPESLLGLMECLCVVCDQQVATGRQEDLLVATQWLLQDPDALTEQLARLPPAHSSQSRRLAPFLLSCDGGWKGAISDAGQCYETFRSWLSCYYQFSLINNQMQATSEQLQQQEQRLEELSRDSEGGTGGVGSTLFRPSAAVWKPASSARRSSSVQSNESLTSRRSGSPTERSSTAGGLRPSPRPGGGPSMGRLSSGSREGPVSSPLKRSAGRSGQGPSPAVNVARASAASSPGRSSSPAQPSSSRSRLQGQRAAEKVESSPRAPRFGHPSHQLGSARAANRHPVGAPPPNPSPRHMDPPKTSAASRRQNVPAVRARRSPSRDPASPGSANAGPGPKVVSAFASRTTPSQVVRRESGASASASVASGISFPDRERDIEHEAYDTAGQATPAPVSSRASGAQSPALARSHSEQSIPEPAEAGPTPPLSFRGMRSNEASLASSARSDRLHRGSAHQTVMSRHATTSTPQPTRHAYESAAPSPTSQRHSAGSTAQQSRQQHDRHNPVGSARLTRFAAPPSAGSGGTPAGSALRRTGQNQHSRSSLASGRKLTPSESATTLRHSDAGSGGTSDRNSPARDRDQDRAAAGGYPSGALSSSRSTSALEMRGTSGRLSSRDTPMITPRVGRTSARNR